MAEYARVAQVDSDALYRWRALFKRKGVSIAENLGAAAVSFAAVQVSDTQPSGGTPCPNGQHCDSPMIAETPVEVGFFLDSEDGRQ